MVFSLTEALSSFRFCEIDLRCMNYQISFNRAILGMNQFYTGIKLLVYRLRFTILSVLGAVSRMINEERIQRG